MGKKHKLGKKLEHISVGEKLSLTEKMEDKDLLLFLGLTNDANPLYIQHDYASKTMYKKPIVPTIMLTGIITTAISKYIPGPGSHILKQEIDFLQPVHHYAIVQFLFEVVNVNHVDKTVTIYVEAMNETEEAVIKGKLLVRPPLHFD
ncbi:MaoC/PaaZ C-terminal domain-containing protein [Bacillus sp. N9]